jgi:EAL domain-containing protein (putative c-di-GMP-specific phosphodiesterase class I)
VGLIERFRRQSDDERDLNDPGNIRRALWLEQFNVHFQPIVDVESGALAGVEALVRWDHPDVGTIPAQRFVPVAERAGLLLPLDVDTLRVASEFRRDLGVSSDQLRVTLNLAASELMRPELVDTLQKILDQTGLPADQLEVELAEEALQADPGSIAATVRRLHEAGISISIDDFGADEEMLKLLQKLPVDRVKIDLGAVPANLVGDPTEEEVRAYEEARASAEAAIERAVVQAMTWGVGIGAKRVESIEHLRLLRQMDIARAQGFVLGRPVSSAEFGDLGPELRESA